MKKFSTLSLLLLFSIVLSAQQNDKLQRQIDSIVVSGKEKFKVVGISVAAVKNETVVYNSGFGFRNIVTKEKISSTSVFHTASISKLFTATAIQNLVEHKHFNLDDPIGALIPEFRMADERYKKITVRQLLNHTSGMPDVTHYHWSNSNIADPDALKNYMISFRKRKLKSNPGEHFFYSSMGYDLLGYLIEKTTGEVFNNYMKRMVLGPTGMVNSSFSYLELPTSQHTSPHSKRPIFKNIYVRKVYPYNMEHAPSSTLNASTSDLALWIKDILHSLSTNADSKNVSASSLKSMLNPNEKFPFIGLGWFKGKLEGDDIFFHFGGDKGFRSYLMIIPNRNTGLVLLANCDYEEDFRQYILHAVAKVILEK